MIANTERGTKPSTDLPRIPPGWASNPSSKRRRIVLAALAFIGFCVAGYLALYQLGLFSTVWEPFFGQGSHKILDSSLSRALPVPDAALGAAVYLADTLLTLSGDAERWRSKSWFALANGVVAAGLALTGVGLLIVQPLAYHGYCTLCMVSAVISINLVGPALEELLAASQHLARTRRETSAGVDDNAPGRPFATPQRARGWRSSGVRLWYIIAAAIGLWLMAAPAVIDYAGNARVADRLVGPLVFGLSVAAIWPATRLLGWLDLVAGCWLIIRAFALSSPTTALMASVLCGVVLIGLAISTRSTGDETGGGWRAIFHPGVDGSNAADAHRI